MINRVHEKALRVILGHNLSEFESLLEGDKGICSHHKNIQSLMVEMFKVKNKLAPAVMGSMFERRNDAKTLRNFREFLTKRIKTVHFDLETLTYWFPQI